jgi:hypothetical protein
MTALIDSAPPSTPTRSALGRSAGSAIGGPEIWNVVAWGDVRECRDIATIIDEVREALELGCRTISIQRQGSPNGELGTGGEPGESVRARVRAAGGCAAIPRRRPDEEGALAHSPGTRWASEFP